MPQLTRPVSQPDVLAILYVRVSLDEMARDGLSLPAQLAECRRYAMRQGWKIGPEYQDVMKGTRDDRPQYQAMLAEIRRRAGGERIAVVVSALDRFGRSVEERVRSRRELVALDVPVHSVREGGEVSELVWNILASVAQEEVRRISERVSGVRRHVRAQGWWPGGNLPLGYALRPATPRERLQGAPKSVLEADARAAPLVVELFERAARSESSSSLARWAQSWPSEARGRKAVSFNAVRYILRNRVYVADPPARWQRLIEPSLFDLVQVVLARRSLTKGRENGQFPLTGRAICGECGFRMAGVTPTARRGRLRQRRYMCRAGSGGRGRRCYNTVLAEPVERQVFDEIRARLEGILIGSSEFREALRKAWEARRRGDSSAERRRRLKQIERDLMRAQQRKNEAAIKLIDGVIDKATYDQIYAVFERETDALRAEAERLGEARSNQDLPPFETILNLARGWLPLMLGTVAEARPVVDLLLERVELRRTGRKKPPEAQPVWTALGATLAELVPIREG